MRIFFKGLNELRGLAALAVVFHHIELYKHREKVSSLFAEKNSGWIENLGKNGVYLFFVLSGFLITYLLLSEKTKTDTISAGKFYIRRILRIWPLYYLIVFVSFFVFPWFVQHFELAPMSYYTGLVNQLSENFGWKLILFLLFLPNLALAAFTPVAGASQSWSVGVEEQFYLLWPQLLKRFSNVVAMLIGVIVFKFILLGGLIALNSKLKDPSLKTAIVFVSAFNIELMALGGLGAWLLFHQKLTIFYSRIPRVASFILVIVILAGLFFTINYFALAILFLLLIVLNISDEHYVFRNRLFSFFGDISYGIYMYHPLVMFTVFTFIAPHLSAAQILTYNIVIYGSVIGLTVLVSFVSYRFVETYFLKLKDRFVIVASGKKLES